MKTLKIYLKNCPDSSKTKIYCIKHDIGENLETLKEKINLRVPQLRFATNEPCIYWFDLENDKIRMACDDDLKFFMEESEIRKLIFDYKNPQETSRKRRSTLPIDLVDEDDDDHTEFSKRLKKIDLSSDSSSMDTDSSETSKDTSVISLSDGSEPSTSQQSQNIEINDNQPKVKIISIETIETTTVAEDALNGNNNKNDNENVVIETVQAQVDSGNETSIEDQQQEENIRTSESSSNRIVISDSSDDEEDFSNNNNSSRYQHFNSNGNNFYAYSFANANINGARPNENFRNFMHSNLRENRRRLFREQAFMRENILASQEIMRDNLRAVHETARENLRHARRSVDNARRSVQNQILHNFRAHFSPLFTPNFGYRH